MMTKLNRREFVAASVAAAGSGLMPRVAEAAPRTDPVLRQSDVVFMYQADRKVYDDYGATVLAWGGVPTPQTLQEARGIRFFGSVGMVTEFARYYERFPQSYEEGLCRDVSGKPVKVPWLTDMQHKGVPFWWCCTNQPVFRAYIRERVVETVKAGAHGVHVDDHLGTAGGLWLGVCFCDRCVEGFASFQGGHPDFRAEALKWAQAHGGKAESVTQHPLWAQWITYQCRSAAAFMMELRKLAAETAGHPVPIGENAGLLWPRHLSDYKAVDLFSAETDHGADKRQWIDTPLVAYRLADAVGRPYAATASGGDWAFVKANNVPGLVRGWIALGYGAGHCLMAPHHQWCYTPEKGTHWYDGPSEKFAPLYRFVRDHASLLDGYESHADLSVVMPHRSFVKDPARWAVLFDRLSAANLSYRILLAGDEIVDHPLAGSHLRTNNLLVPNAADLLPPDSRLIADRKSRGVVFTDIDEAMRAVRPAIRIGASSRVLALPRVKPGSAVIHLVNRSYNSKADDATPVKDVKITIDLSALCLKRAGTCRWVMPDSPAVRLRIANGVVTIPTVGLWGMLVI